MQQYNREGPSLNRGSILSTSRFAFKGKSYAPNTSPPLESLKPRASKPDTPTPTSETKNNGIEGRCGTPSCHRSYREHCLPQPVYRLTAFGLSGLGLSNKLYRPDLQKQPLQPKPSLLSLWVTGPMPRTGPHLEGQGHTLPLC